MGQPLRIADILHVLAVVSLLYITAVHSPGLYAQVTCISFTKKFLYSFENGILGWIYAVFIYDVLHEGKAARTIGVVL
jgi:hypothetical protein